MTFFRANVGIMLVNEHKQVLALERADIAKAWQMPQGGIDEGEDPLLAAKRELHEETGIPEDKFEFRTSYPTWLAYELPPHMRRPQLGMGQVQKWFLFRYLGTDEEINLETAKDKEFKSWKWMSLGDLAETTVTFRRRIYWQLAHWLSEIPL